MNARNKRLAAGAGEAPRPSSVVERSGAVASVPSGLNVLAGIWLMVAATMFDYRTIGAGLDGRWIDLAVGFAIVVVALTRAIAPRAVARIGWGINVLLGTWLIIAPLLLGHGGGSVVVNDIVVGAVVVVLTCLSLALTKKARPDLNLDRQPGDSARFQ
ncbi:SPW repeat domain-containing protein [Lentzea sp. E54]|uniref:SPW repeat domain-containing protein n=1 Tax=Lentzea xerophila TaxID=3435883 RepID=UPI003DA2F70E